MTKKEIVDIIRVEFHGNGNYIEAFEKAADKILAEEAKEKPTAPACPTCGMGVKLTERRIDGNSTCFNGHTHKTKDFYHPSTQADIVGELKEVLKKKSYIGDDECATEVIPVNYIEEVITKFEGEK